MTDKELQKLRRADLIELLYYLSKENDELRAENAQLQARLDALVETALTSVHETAAAGSAGHTGKRNKSKKRK